MSKELDRRVAELVMGEPKPTWRRPDAPRRVGEASMSAGGGWWRRSWNHDWEPLAFSSNLDHAMTAVDTRFQDDDYTLHMHRMKTRDGVEYVVYRIPHYRARDSIAGVGQTLPEAICRLLLSLSEKEI